MTTSLSEPQVCDAYPLSALQAGMLFHSSYAERGSAYHDILTVTLRGVFSRPALIDTLADVTHRHPVLRTSFDLVTFSEPLQLVHSHAVMPLDVLDWSDRDPAQAQRDLDTWRDQQERLAFDWAVPPLLRVTAHVLAGDQFAITLNFHHAILDGWSLATLVTEILDRYLGHLTGQPRTVVPPQDIFAEFIGRERESVTDPAAVAYWRQIVTDAPGSALAPALGYPRPDASAAGTRSADVDPDLRDRLTAVAGDLGVPLRTVLLAAHVRVIGLLTGEREILTGCVTHGRPETEGAADVLGLFLNTVPIRARLDVPTWADLIRQVLRTEVDAMAHRSFPHFEIQQLAGRSPLVAHLFDVRDFHVYRDLPEDPRVTVLRRDHREHIDIPFGAAFGRSAAGELSLTLKYDRSQYPPEQIATILSYYLVALRQIAADPDGSISDTDAFLRGGDAQHIDAWNRQTARPVIDLGLHEVFVSRAEATPDAVAIVDAAGEHTYGYLRRRANALAARLRDAGAGPETVVAIGLDRGVEFVVALLGVLMSGAAALPLDRDQPVARLSRSVADAGASVLIDRGDSQLTFDGTILAPTGDESPTAPAVTVHPDSLAYLLYTSGSTGRPKGVMLSHRAVVNYIAGVVERLAVTPEDRVAQRVSVGWDGSVVEHFVALCTGAVLVVVPTEAMADPATMIELASTHRVSLLFLVPSIITGNLESGAFAQMPSLRVVGSAGEALPQQMADGFAAQTRARLFNFYGPTEAGIGAADAYVRAGAPGVIAAIGGPVSHAHVHILDDRGHRLPIGVPGELYVGSPLLARGYRGNPRLTAERFLPDHLSGPAGGRLYRTGDRARWLPDGQLEFFGRTDGQLKIRGIRVELGEVEAALLTHPAVRRAVVITRADRDGAVTLAAYVVVDRVGPAVASDLREHLRQRLARAVVPSSIQVLPELPLLANGKVDRLRLPEPPQGPTGTWVGPRDPVESRLSLLWAETLGVPTVGVFDDFFELGGHSLSALRLTMRIQREFQRSIPVEALLSASTVERLANLLRTAEDIVPPQAVVTLCERGTGTPLFLIHGLGGQIFRFHTLVGYLGEDRPVYAIPARGFAASDDPHTSIEAMAADYAERIRSVAPHGPYLLGGYCIGGNIALEVARRLRADGGHVPAVAMFWTHASEPVMTENLNNDAVLMMFALAGGVLNIDSAELADRPADEQLTAILNAASSAGRLTPEAADVDQARRILRVYRANAHAVGFHRHEPYDGDVVLLIPREDPDFPPGDVFGWDSVVTGTLFVDGIPGDHNTAVDEPLIGESAAILRRWLSRVDDH